MMLCLISQHRGLPWAMWHVAMWLPKIICTKGLPREAIPPILRITIGHKKNPSETFPEFPLSD